MESLIVLISSNHKENYKTKNGIEDMDFKKNHLVNGVSECYKFRYLMRLNSLCVIPCVERSLR